MSTDFYKDGGAPEFPNPKPTPRPILQPRVSDCPKSERKDGKHSWKFDGDDPYVECCYCGQYQDAISGRVIKPVSPSPTPQDEPREDGELRDDILQSMIYDPLIELGIDCRGDLIVPVTAVEDILDIIKAYGDQRAQKAHEDGYREGELIGRIKETKVYRSQAVLTKKPVPLSTIERRITELNAKREKDNE